MKWRAHNASDTWKSGDYEISATITRPTTGPASVRYIVTCKKAIVEYSYSFHDAKAAAEQHAKGAK